MADAPTYSTVPGKIGSLLRKIRETGVPAKATKVWLQSIGFTSSNDPSLLPVLKAVGFADMAGVPTPAWREYRGSQHRTVLGRAIRSGYADLFAVYPDAQSRRNSDIASVFSTRSDSGKQAIDKAVATFKALVAEADFDEELAASPQEPPGGVGGTKAGATQDLEASVQIAPAGGPVVNINVQLTLPETTDPAVYDTFFRSMKSHLLGQE
jgi:hypothetical protein